MILNIIYKIYLYIFIILFFLNRSLEHSTILYESPQSNPLLRVNWNRQDPNYIATIATDSNKVVILDVR